LGGERYDDLWWLLLRMKEAKQAEQWLARLEDQTVVDLGSGQNTLNFQRFLTIYGAKHYIAVDKISRPAFHYMDSELITGDMLETLRSLPSKAFSVSMNGINKELIDPNSPETAELREEILRVLHPEGLILGVGGGGILQVLTQKPELNSLFIPIAGMPEDKDNGFYLLAKRNLSTGPAS